MPEKLSCQAKTAMLATISRIVTSGSREVGTLSLSGIGKEARDYPPRWRGLPL